MNLANYLNQTVTPLSEYTPERKRPTTPRKRKNYHNSKQTLEEQSEARRNWAVERYKAVMNPEGWTKTQDIDDNRAFRPDAANLAAFLYWMKLTHPTEYRHVVEHVQLVAPFFDDFTLEPSRTNPNKIKLEWKQKGSDAYFDGFSLSDGTLRFICLAVLLLQPSLPSLILLDEPELGLHPFAITILAEMIEAAARRSQVILATQSVTLLNQFAPEAIIIADNDGLRTHFRRLAEQGKAPDTNGARPSLRDLSLTAAWILGQQ